VLLKTGRDDTVYYSKINITVNFFNEIFIFIKYVNGKLPENNYLVFIENIYFILFILLQKAFLSINEKQQRQQHSL